VTASAHISVLLNETLTLLDPRPGGRYVDCTADGGGHSAAILERSAPDGLLLAMDTDPEMVGVARNRLATFDGRARVVHANFRDLEPVAAEHGFLESDGILMDLGWSSRQMETDGRGFSFMRDEALDMRYDRTAGPSAAELLATSSVEELEQLLRAYGEEPRARRIAQEIVASRARAQLATTGELAALVARAVGGRHGRLHPATRTFQALRIAVNDELGALAEALPQAFRVLRPGGRLVVIAFHSLEDRIVKTCFRRLAGQASVDTPRHLPVSTPVAAAEVRILTRHPLSPSEGEVTANPRSRSARLRAVERR
jgi:16S rRNA (cytosine1402-N4)-methyltransferase